MAPFKKGPDYIDPMWIGLSADHPCVNLDFNSMSEREIAEKFTDHCRGRKMAMVEGTMGLFDGIDPNGSDSNAALAKQLGLPVILVIDCRGMTRGIAPLLTGYAAFDPRINLIGVVLNNVAGSRHESKLRAAISEYTDLPVIGAVPHHLQLLIGERHLGLETSAENEQAEHIVKTIASILEPLLDMDMLLELTSQHNLRLIAKPQSPRHVRAKGIRLGIARDRAFSFYYADDLETMEKAGFELKYFSPIDDQRLPDADALFIGGGFPELYAEHLERNQSMREAVADFCSSGRPVYAECGGLMYLSRSVHWQDRRYRMTGFFAADVRIGNRPIGRGYVELQPTRQHLWHEGCERQEQESQSLVRAHEFHHSSIEGIEEGVDFAWQVVRGHGVDGRHDGFVRQGVLAGFAHLRNTQRYPWIEHFTHFIDQRPVGQ